MTKDVKKVIRKMNWKFWTLILAIAILLFVLVYSFFVFSFQTWLSSILFPVILSAVASIGVSLWFTAKTEKDNIYRTLLDELHELFDYSFQLSRSIESILSTFTIPLLSKKRIIINDIARKPNLFYIPRHYREFYELFEKKQKELLELVGNIDTNKNTLFLPADDPLYFEYIFKTLEITEETLKLQEQILQDFKRIPKGPIKDQLLFNLGSNKNKKDT